ncbi:hypothetical protein SVAN01_00016 [Stagonosporopsis vannaccii]|nr:hypothetical protein SVAN01_00016 [Stagonosporopsis vannaccii]
MVLHVRYLARNVSAKGRLNTPTPTAVATARRFSHHQSKTWSCPGRRNLHTDNVSGAVSANQTPVYQISTFESSRPEVLRETFRPDWRHPRFGFATADFPHLVYIKLPRTATEDDVKALIARAGLQNAKIFMYYYFETGKPEDFCFVRIADGNDIDTVIASLSRFTLLGSDLKPEKFNMWKAPPQSPNLLAGWLPSPSSDLSARIIRPPKTEPPNLLAMLLKENWLQVMGLPAKVVDGEDSSKVAEALYKQFHHLDVLGITRPKLRYKHGVCCKILFGTRSAAKKARALHVEGSFMGKPGKAKIYRGGPQVHKALWDYRQSLPEDFPNEQMNDLLEKRFKQISFSPADIQRWKDYPTSESAIGLKDS